MFNVKHWVEVVGNWLGESTGEAIPALERYGRWLRDEAIVAGGLGPREGARIEDRHIADSLAFAAGLDPDVETVLDIGTGVGLPGIPLAILRPACRFVLLDRSGRRADLTSRAVRVLDLQNVTVVTRDIGAWTEPQWGLVMRATLPPNEAFPQVRRLLRPGGSAVVGLSRRGPAPNLKSLGPAAHAQSLKLEVIEVPVLDSPSWLLRIEHNDYDS